MTPEELTDIEIRHLMGEIERLRARVAELEKLLAGYGWKPGLAAEQDSTESPFDRSWPLSP